MPKVLDLLTGKMREVESGKRNKSPEAKVKAEIEEYFRRIDGYVRQINSGGVMRGGKWNTSGQGSGISDLICWLPFGRNISVEVKAPGKKRTASEAQFRHLEKVISRGHIGCLADSVQCVRLAMEQSKEEMLKTLHSFKPVKRVKPVNPEPLFPD